MPNSSQLWRHEKKVWSQNGEDGVIGGIFEALEVTNRYYVEFGVGNASECNTRYLNENGWNGLWMDSIADPNGKIKRESISAENIVTLLEKYRVPHNFDLLSIDVDSNDYWIFDKLAQVFKPRVIVVEYNGSYPPPIAATVKYEPDLTWHGTDYFGASLSAWSELMGAYDYALIGCESRGVNAFFVQKSLICKKFGVLTDFEAYVPPQYGRRIDGQFLGHPADERRLIPVGQQK